MNDKLKPQLSMQETSKRQLTKCVLKRGLLPVYKKTTQTRLDFTLLLMQFKLGWNLQVLNRPLWAIRTALS